MKIKLIHSIMEIHFFDEKLFTKFFEPYIVSDEKTDLFIYQEEYQEDEFKGDKKIDSRFYDLYIKDNVETQYQKDEEGKTYVGKIIYDDKQMRFSTKKKDDFSQIILLLHYIVTRYLQTKYDCLLMHGSSISYKDKGIIFTAPSGTGKSTHSRLWKTYYDVVYVNDDKNFIVLEDEKLYLYGNPWSGKHFINNNIIVQLTDIVFLYQNPTNVVTKLTKREAFMKLMYQVVTPQNEDTFDKWNRIIDKILELPCYSLGCRIDKEAVDTIKNAIEGEQ